MERPPFPGTVLRLCSAWTPSTLGAPASKGYQMYCLKAQEMPNKTSAADGAESISCNNPGNEAEEKYNSNEHCVMGEVDANNQNKENTLSDQGDNNCCRRVICWRACMPQAKVKICMFLLLISIIVIVGLGVMCGLSSVTHPATTILSCPSRWIGYRDRCYYFSDTEGTWNFSLSNCSAYDASLAPIENKTEMDFIMRYKGSVDHWIGLRREEEDKPWKWTNGSQFNNWFEIRANGLCAYLDDDSARSTWCKTERKWICSKSLRSS